MSFKIELKERMHVGRGPVVLWTVTTVDGVVVGHSQYDIFKIDAKTLKVSWKCRARGFAPRGAVRDGVLLVFGEKGIWRLVDSGSGRPIWTLEVGAAEGLGWGDYDLLDKNPIRILDLNAGKIVDQFEVPGGPIKDCVVSEDVLLMTTAYRKEPKRSDPIRAYHLSDRRLQWSKDLVGEANGRFGVAEGWPQFILLPGGGGRFLVTRNKDILGYALADGSLLWRQPCEVPYAFPDLRDDRLYAWIYRENLAGHLVALEEPTGRVIYDIPLARYGGPFAQIQQPQQAGLGEQHIVFTTRGSSGLVAIFRLADGELVWSYEHDDELSLPVVLGNQIYIPATSGEVLVFEVEGTL